MRRFMLFAGNVYYPHGGFDDFQRSYHKLEEAVVAAQVWRGKHTSWSGGTWAHIVDRQIGQIVWDTTKL